MPGSLQKLEGNMDIFGRRLKRSTDVCGRKSLTGPSGFRRCTVFLMYNFLWVSSFHSADTNSFRNDKNLGVD
jgi:hypothetical protein